MRSQDRTPDDLLDLLTAAKRQLERERLARQTAEAASKAKSDLLATVSHEVRTPMGAIISMADLLLATSLDAGQRRYAETLQQSSRGLLTVLNDILDYSKLEAGRFELECQDFDLVSLLQSVAAGLAARASEKSLETSLNVQRTCPRHLHGDPVRIRQILNNLTDNALKFTAHGGIHLKVEYSLDINDVILRFEVRDTGIGLPDGRLQTLFQPYVQANSSIAVQYGGTGLGLTISQRLVNLMDGELGCESVEGEGSVFWFTIKLQRAKSSAHEERVDTTETAPGQLCGHVLVVEDNAVNRMLIAAYLERFGLRHSMAFNGRQALEMLQHTGFDLVLMDIMMPEMDGIVATKHIRALSGPAAQVPIVALTANAMKGDRETYLKAGMSDYVSKPINARDLLAVLSTFLAKPQQMAGAL